MTAIAEPSAALPRLFDATIVANTKLCREHFRLTLAGVNLEGARAGQFLHLAPPIAVDDETHRPGTACSPVPLLRRAFSIAGLRSRGNSCEMDVIYRVVGTATTWMASLAHGDQVSVIGPLGNAFPVRANKQHAWMVGGGVGLPPMLWLAEALQAANRRAVAFVGARSADLLALNFTNANTVSNDPTRAVMAAEEFNASTTPLVISTDDGSLGFKGFAPQALARHFESSGIDPDDLVVYTCGPEVMMEAVARFCLDRSIECHVCMERSMACGTGTCQSCVVAVREKSAVDGWRYELCCTQGPVFEAGRVIWSADPGGGVQH